MAAAEPFSPNTEVEEARASRRRDEQHCSSANSGGAPSSSMSSSFLEDAPAFPPPYATAAPMDSPPELRKENQRIWKLSRYRLRDEANSGMDEASSSVALAHNGSGSPLTCSGSRSPELV